MKTGWSIPVVIGLLVCGAVGVPVPTQRSLTVSGTYESLISEAVKLDHVKVELLCQNQEEDLDKRVPSMLSLIHVPADSIRLFEDKIKGVKTFVVRNDGSVDLSSLKSSLSSLPVRVTEVYQDAPDPSEVVTLQKAARTSALTQSAEKAGDIAATLGAKVGRALDVRVDEDSTTLSYLRCRVTATYELLYGDEVEEEADATSYVSSELEEEATTADEEATTADEEAITADEESTLTDGEDASRVLGESDEESDVTEEEEDSSEYGQNVTGEIVERSTIEEMEPDYAELEDEEWSAAHRGISPDADGESEELEETADEDSDDDSSSWSAASAEAAEEEEEERMYSSASAGTSESEATSGTDPRAERSFNRYRYGSRSRYRPARTM